jgi:hypothetical protein
MRRSGQKGFLSSAAAVLLLAVGAPPCAAADDLAVDGSLSVQSNLKAKGSVAAGQHAQAQHAGSHVWADSANTNFVSTAANQFLIRAAGGVGIGTNAPQATLHVAGTARFDGGVSYVPPTGNLAMGSYTNAP